MILAAGLGTRLRPLTDHVPKALIEVGGRAILERVARQLIDAGADRLIINLHHFGPLIRDYVSHRDGFGVEVVYSEEPDRPLETGGGLLRAAPLLRKDAPFFLHNADIFTNLPLAEMYAAHLRAPDALATLAVMERRSSRYLLFDEKGLYGRVDEGRDLRVEVRHRQGVEQRLAFGGVHVVDSALPDLLTETGAFSILDPYLRLAAAGRSVLPFRADHCEWIDIGKPDQLEAARRMVSAR